MRFTVGDSVRLKRTAQVVTVLGRRPLGLGFSPVGAEEVEVLLPSGRKAWVSDNNLIPARREAGEEGGRATNSHQKEARPAFCRQCEAEFSVDCICNDP